MVHAGGTAAVGRDYNFWREALLGRARRGLVVRQ
jgi:hypothetical protein